MVTPDLKAPFPWFGGKSRVTDIVWPRFGKIKNYVEPFFGSGAVLLGRPDWVPGMTETINDYDGFVANFWRAVKYDPEAVAEHADWPVNENDLHARNYYLAIRRETFRAKVEGDPDFYDAKIAGWWVWGVCAWIRSPFATIGSGPWSPDQEGRLVKVGGSPGVRRQRPEISYGRGVHRKNFNINDNLTILSSRLRSAKVCCGDWKRSFNKTINEALSPTGIFLDPPYDLDTRDAKLYAHDGGVWDECWRWCLSQTDSKSKIALCGYDGSWSKDFASAGWEEVPWKTAGGYARGRKSRGVHNQTRERIWFSPACKTTKEALFD